MKKNLLFSLCILLAGLPVQAKQSLDLSRLSPQTRDSLLKEFPQFKSNQFDTSDLDALLKFVIGREAFDSAQITYNENTQQYFLNVGKVRRISKIVILGADELAEPDVRREFTISEKAIFEQTQVIEAAERVKNYYIQSGFPNPILDLEFQLQSPVEMAIILKITEGPRTRITKVEVNSENEKLKKKIQKMIADYRKEVLTETLLSKIRDEVRESLSSDGYYRAELVGPEVKINPSETEAHLVYKIERPEKFEIEVSGTKEYWKSEIISNLELDKFFTSNPSIASELANRIRNFYLKNGFARVDVETEERTGKTSYDKILSFKIKEGPKVRIEKYEISGRYSLPVKKYVEILTQNSSDLIEDGFYFKDDIDLGLKNLVIDRQNQGYLRAKISSVRTIYNRDRNGLSLLINFDEGPLTQLETLSFQGNNSFLPEELQKIVNLVPQTPLRLNSLEESIGKLKNFYRSQGYLEMEITNEKEIVSYNIDSSLAQVLYKIDEGPQIRVANIIVEGNSLTKDRVILKELEFKQGDILTPQLIEESIQRMQRLGIFANIEIRTLEEKTQIANRTVIIRVADRDPGLLNAGLGATNDQGFTVRGFLGLAYRNIFGTGRAASARIEGNYNVSDIKYLENKVTLGYLEPYLFDTRVRGRLNLTRSKQVSDFEKEVITEVNQTTWSIEQDLTSHITASYDLYSLATVIDTQRNNNNAIFQRKEQNIATTGPNLDIDFRDHPFNPSRGTFTRFNLEYSSPELGSTDTIEYWRAFGSFTHYSPVRRNWVWANSLRGGYLKNLSTLSDGGVPYDKKGLILGGQSTVRGFQPGESFPGETELGTDRYLLTTEAQMYLIKSELRFPIWGSLGAALFYDGGAVTIKGVDIKDPYRDSVGIAFRYATPVGAVSLEWGWKLDRKTGRGESQLPFHLSIGTF
ncbi:MAG: BamA/TamA family outer membrane protein [Proteobacteria bacterium]|jgi:outer membrane protein assembly complex protein YaeT|nr:BamA/TamA family outer membrane protein [Pseudomonadota bacterium]